MQTGQLITPAVTSDGLAWCYCHLFLLMGSLSILARRAAYLGGCATALFATLTVGSIRQMPTLMRFGCFVRSLLERCLSDAEAMLFQVAWSTTAWSRWMKRVLLSKLCLVAVGR